MNLIERARNWKTCLSEGAMNGAPVQTKALLEELAGEVERLWAFEKDYAERLYPAWQATKENMHRAYSEMEDSLTAEIVELKAKVDTEGMMRKWLDGYKVAVSQLQPIIHNLLRVSDFGPPAPTDEGHYHDGHVDHES